MLPHPMKEEYELSQVENDGRRGVEYEVEMKLAGIKAVAEAEAKA